MRKKLRTLQTILRLSLCGVSLMAAATAWFWNRRPEQIERTASVLEERLNGPYLASFEAAMAEPDARKAEGMLLQWIGDTAHVRRQDHLAVKVESALQWLSQAAEAREDKASATYWLRRWVAFNDHSLYPQVRLAELLCSQDDKLSEGIELLQSLVARFPGHPDPAGRLVEYLVHLDRPQEAWNVVRANEDSPRANVWTVLWNAGTGFDYDTRRATLLRVVEDGVLRMRFSVAEPVHGVEFRMPPFCARLLSEPSIQTTSGQKQLDLSLGDPEAIRAGGVQLTLNEIAVDQKRLRLDGGSMPILRLDFQEPIPANTPIQFRAKVIDLPLRPMMAPLRRQCFAQLAAELDQRGATAEAAHLRRLRALSTIEDGFELFWSTGTIDFTSERSQRCPVELSPAGSDIRFRAQFAPQSDTDHLRLDLPLGIGIAYQVDEVTLRSGETDTALDIHNLQIVIANDVVLRDGKVVVSGEDPYVSFRLPKLGKVDSVRVGGFVR